MRERLQAPSAEHWMGTDASGRDIYSRAIYGSRVSVRVGYAVVALTTLFGLIIGVAAGFYRWLDGLLMRTMDGLMAFPSIFLAIAILAALGPNENNVIVALTVTQAPSTARIVRGVVLSIKEFDYIGAARASGARDLRVLVWHVVPNSLAPLIVQSTFILGVAVLSEAGVSFVGAGIQPPTASWGNMLSDAKRYLYVAPWMSYFPGIFIVLAVLGLNLLGDGLRVLGMTHYMDSTYAHGTGTEGGLKESGPDLLRAMAEVGMILDLTHLADQSFWEALDLWEGPVIASHQNARALVPGQRQFDDDQLRAVIERGGVVGGALDAWMMVPGWVRGETRPGVVNLDTLVDHMAHVCDLVGNVRHVAIGSDLDGGYGTEQTPRDLDTIADLQKLPGLLRARGFGDDDVAAVLHGNWLRLLDASLPEGSRPAS
ncbi:MAG: membrane dipeptidase [Trueperaceae bacterium]